MPNIKSISLLVHKLWIFDLWPWTMPLTLTCHVQSMQLWKINIHNKYQVSISTGSKVMAHCKFDIWPCRMTLTLWWSTQNMRLYEIHLYTNYQMYISIGSKVMAKTLYLTFDLKEWPWPYIVTTPNVQPRDSYTKYQRSNPIGSNVMANVTYIFDLWPWRMTLTLTYYPSKCVDFIKYTFLPNIKSVSVFAQK